MDNGCGGKFIYVFSEKDKDYLIGCGFHMLKEDKTTSGNPVYVFVNDPLRNYALLSSKYVDTNILTF